MRRTTRYGFAHGVNVQIRVGLNSGEVVVRAIGSDLHMDYTAVGQTTHLAARMEQLASPGSILLAPATLELAEGFVAVKPLGPMPVKGLADAVEVYEALVLAAELGMRPLVAHCHLGLAKLQRRIGSGEQAREHLATATRMYREMDMRFWLEQARAESRELGA
jgi:hypothetical protein